MRIEGKIFCGNIMTREVTVTREESRDVPFVRTLELALIDVCRELESPIPLWLSKNTHEFAAFHQTIFFRDQFTEKTNFDRFQIRLL